MPKCSDSMIQSAILVDGELHINGKKMPPLPKNKPYRRLVQNGNRIFLNGYELVDGKWKRTLRAFLANW